MTRAFAFYLYLKDRPLKAQYHQLKTTMKLICANLILAPRFIGDYLFYCTRVSDGKGESNQEFK